MKIQKLAEAFKALSHPHRLAIFMRLSKCCERHGCSADDCSRLCVGELGKGLNISPSTISHHLKELSRAGLISTQKSGQSVKCWVSEKTLDELSQFFLKVRKS